MKLRVLSAARLSFPLATALAAMLAPLCVKAQSWSGATSGAWLTTTNWTGGVAAGSPTTTANANIAVFNVAAQPTIGIGMNTTLGVYYLGAIDNTNATARIINNSSTTAGVLTLNGATVNSVANTIVRNSTTALLTITNGATTGTMGLALGNATDNIIQITGTGGITIPSIISGTGRNLTRQGSGTGVLILSGANSYTGLTTVSAGVLNIQNATALGTVAGGTTVAAGAALQIQNTITVGAEALSLSGTGIANDGALRNINQNNTYGGLVTLGAASRVNSNTFATALTLTGGITAANQNLTIGGVGNTTINTTGVSIGSGSLIKDGSGTLTLNAVNTYTGATSLLEGRLNITRETALYNGAPVDWTAANINVKAGATLALNVDSLGANGFTAANLSTLLGNISVAGSATEGLQANAILGLDTTNAGGSFTTSSAIADSTAAFGGAISLNKLGSGTLVLDQANTYTGTTTVTAGTLQLGSGGTTGSLSASSAITVASGAAFAINRSDSVTQGTDFSAAPITGAGGFTQAGSGTTVLTAANTFTGTTTVSNGVLQLDNALALQNSALSISGTGTVTLGAGVTLPAFGGVSGSTDLATVIPGYTSVTNLTLNPQSGSTFTYAGIVSDGVPPMSLTKTGLGTQVLTGVNTYTGTTIINAGTLRVGDGLLGSLNGTTGTALTFTGTGIFNVAEAASSTQGMGVLTLSAGDGTVTSTAAGAASTATLTFGSLAARTAGATGNFTLAVNTTSTGATPNTIVFTDSTNFPPASGSNDPGLFFGGSNYARYDDLGFARAVTYGTDLNATAALSGPAVTDLGAIGATIDSRFNGGTRATTTSGAAASTTNTNTLVVTNGSLFTVGQILTGTNIAANTHITAISGNTLTLANPIQAAIRGTAVAAGATLTPYNSVTAQTTGSLNTLNLSGAGASFTLGASQTLDVNGILRSGSPAGQVAVISGGTGLRVGGSGGEMVVRTDAANDSLVIASPILDNGGSSLTKSGAGELYLNGANTYTGDTIINGGTLGINNAASFGSGKVLVKGSSTILVNGSGGGSGVTYPNDIDVGSPLTLRIPLFINNQGNPGTQFFSGKLTGSNPISVDRAGVNGGTGFYAFTNAANTFTGDVLMAAGTSGTADGNDHFTFKSIGDGGNFVFRKRGHRNSIEYIGDAPIVFNTRRIGLGSEFGNGAFDGGGVEPINSFRNNSSDPANTVTFNTSILPATVSSAVVPGYLFFAGNNTGNNTFAGTIPDMLNQPLNIGKNDTGRWLLSGLNTYSGTTLIANGTLSVNMIDVAANAQPLGKGAVIQLGNSGTSGTLEYTGATDGSTDKQVVLGLLNNNNQVGAGGIVNNSAAGSLTFSNPNFNLTTGATVTTVARTLTLGGSNTGANTISGTIRNNNTAPVALAKTGAGTWQLSAANTYTGATTLTGGTLILSGSNSSAAATTIGTGGGTLQLDSSSNGGLASGNLNLNSATAVIQALNADRTISNSVVMNGDLGSAPTFSGANSITLTGNLRVNNAAVTLTNNIDPGESLTINTIDRDGANSRNLTVEGTGETIVGGAIALSGGSLTKNGAGAMTLSGVNTYTGSTVVNAGSLTLTDNAQLSFVLGASSGANNSITGAGTVTLDGDFSINTTAADGLSAGSWILENVDTLTTAYGPNFTITAGSGFSDIGGDQWRKTVGSKIYTFDETTGTLTLVTPDPFPAWAASKGLDGTPGFENGKGDDPDGDGFLNLDEFAFDGNPLSGANDGKIVGKIAAVGGNQVLTLTVPVRVGANIPAGSGDRVSDPIDGLIYRFEGDVNLGTFADNITEVPAGADRTAIQLGLPPLSSGDWTYRTFRTPNTVPTVPKAFIRAQVSQAP